MQQPIFLRSLCLVLATIIALGFSSIASAAVPASERAALLSFYTATNGGTWTNNTGWNGVAGSECTWFGITCDVGQNHVTQIRLDLNNLSGPFPDLSAFTQLNAFRAWMNNLSGPLSDLSMLTQMTQFDVAFNDLSGPLPDLSLWPLLRDFVVQNNQFSGPIVGLSGLTGLAEFNISNNQLTGTLPAFPPSPNLVEGAVCPNFLQGPSPTDAAWENFTRQSPWWANCTAPPYSAPPITVPLLGNWTLLMLGFLLAFVGIRRAY